MLKPSIRGTDAVIVVSVPVATIIKTPQVEALVQQVRFDVLMQALTPSTNQFDSFTPQHGPSKSALSKIEVEFVVDRFGHKRFLQ